MFAPASVRFALPFCLTLPAPEIVPLNTLFALCAKTRFVASTMLPVNPEVLPVRVSVPLLIVVVPP